MGKFVNKRPAAEGKAPPVEMVGSCEFLADYPALSEFATVDAWDDGSKRELGTFMVVFEAGWWKCWLHDKALKRSTWVSAVTPTELFRACEDGLRSGSLAWRPDRPYKGKGG